MPILHETLSCNVGTNSVHQGNSTVPSMTSELLALLLGQEKKEVPKDFALL